MQHAGLPQRIEVGRDITGLLIAQAHVRHRVAGENGLRSAQPENHVVGRIEEMSGKVDASGNSAEGGSDKAVGSLHARDLMTRSSSVPRDRAHAGLYIAWHGLLCLR